MNATVIRPWPQGQPMRLHQPIKVEPGGTRIHYFPRRSLGSAEFLLQGQYLDHRLLELGAAQGPGVLDGLGLQPAHWAAAGGATLPPITVLPGTPTWPTLAAGTWMIGCWSTSCMVPQ